MLTHQQLSAQTGVPTNEFHRFWNAWHSKPLKMGTSLESNFSQIRISGLFQSLSYPIWVGAQHLGTDSRSGDRGCASFFAQATPYRQIPGQFSPVVKSPFIDKSPKSECVKKFLPGHSVKSRGSKDRSVYTARVETYVHKSKECT